MIADRETLARLMAQAQKGDAEAYRVVLQSSMQWLKQFFGGRIHPSAIDDLVQETLTSVHRKRATYDPSRPFLPWLAAIARYRWVDQLRRTYRAKEEEFFDHTAEHEIEEELLARLSLNHMLDQLPSSQASAIRMVKIEGHSIAETSIATGQSEPLVKVNIHRGLKRLTKLIEQVDL